MNSDKELTIADYLREFATKELVEDKSITAKMCTLLTGTLGEADCEGACSGTQCEDEPDPAIEMCEINPSYTYSKSQLDWAYHQLAGR